MQAYTQLLFRMWALLALALCLSWSTLVQAVVVPNMYDATFSLTTQSDAQRKDLFEKGFIQVLERISAGKEIEQKDPVKLALRNVMIYVDQYTDEGNRFTIKYNPDLINKLISDIGQTSWGHSRPSVILWLALEEQQVRRLVGSENAPELQATIAAIAEKQGLPVFLPLMDLQDMTAVTANDVWGEFSTVLKEASKRYQAQAILVGKIIHHETPVSGKAWEGHWQLITLGESPSWTIQSDSLEEMLTQGVSGTTRLMIGHYGVKNSKESLSDDKPILIRVRDIQTEADFAKVEAYFSSLDQVNKVSINELAGSLATFEITPKREHDKETLAQAISLDQHLVSLDQEMENEEAQLHYRFVP